MNDNISSGREKYGYVFSGNSISHTLHYFLFHPVNYYRSVGRVTPFPDVDQHSRLDVKE